MVVASIRQYKMSHKGNYPLAKIRQNTHNLEILFCCSGIGGAVLCSEKDCMELWEDSLSE